MLNVVRQVPASNWIPTWRKSHSCASSVEVSVIERTPKRPVQQMDKSGKVRGKMHISLTSADSITVPVSTKSSCGSSLVNADIRNIHEPVA